MSETVALRQRTQQSQRLLEVAKTLNNGSNGDFGDSSSYMKELQEWIEREHKIVDERLRLRLIGERSGVKRKSAPTSPVSILDQSIVQEGHKRQQQSKSTKKCLEHLIADLEKRFEHKCQQTADFPPRISKDVKRKCLQEFQEVISEKYLPTLTCAVCAQLVSENLSKLVLETDKMFEVLKDISGRLVVDKCGKIGN